MSGRWIADSLIVRYSVGHDGGKVTPAAITRLNEIQMIEDAQIVEKICVPRRRPRRPFFLVAILLIPSH
jgi:hypothetical protein